MNQSAQNPTIDLLLPRREVEKQTGISRATLYRMIKSGKFPRSVSIGTGSVRWKQSDVTAWQQSLTTTV
jgi:prophage regulatory protein